MDKQGSPMAQMAQLASEMTGVAVAGQAAGLQLLAAEMQALTQLLPGLIGAETAPHSTEAEIEADFDNMPV